MRIDAIIAPIILHDHCKDRFCAQATAAAQMGARCTKLEPPAHPSAPPGTPGDPMGLYNRKAYHTLHHGVHIASADLKTEEGQKALPPTLYADMGGSLMASEAVLQARLHQLQKGTGVYLEIALSVAALEPHFAARLGAEVGLPKAHIMAMFAPETHTAIAAYVAKKTRQELDALGAAKDIPLHTLVG